MARDGSGNFSLAEAAFVNSTTIDADAVNSDLSDIAAGLTQSMSKDGQTVPTANQPMAGFKHTGVALAASRTDYARADQVIGSVLDYATDTGTATAYAIAPSPGIAAYVVGQRFAFKATNANSGADPTLAVNSLTAGIIYNPDGTSLAAGDIAASAQTVVQVASVTTGTPTFHIQSPTAGVVRKGGTQTITGAKTFSATLAMSGAAINGAVRVDVASATTADIGAAASNYVRLTGTTTIAGLGTVASGVWRHVVFGGAMTLTHSSPGLILPNNGNDILTVSGDSALFMSDGSGNWRCLAYQRLSGAPLLSSTFTNSLSGDVALNNASNYFDGPSVAQGTSGQWLATGTVTLAAAGYGDEFSVKLWDGTTVIASTFQVWQASGSPISTGMAVSLSGIITAPAAIIRISVKCSNTSAKILFNGSGSSKDSTVTATRIG